MNLFKAFKIMLILIKLFFVTLSTLFNHVLHKYNTKEYVLTDYLLK